MAACVARCDRLSGGSVNDTLLEKQAQMRDRHSGKSRTRIAKNTESSIIRLLATLDSVTRADLREKLGPGLAAAVAYDEGVILSDTTTAKQKADAVDSLYKLFL